MFVCGSADGNSVSPVDSMRLPSTYTTALRTLRTCSMTLCGTSATTRSASSEAPAISGVPGETSSPTCTSFWVTTPEYGARTSV